MNIEFSPTAFMQDACRASKTALQSLLPKSELYMCWYHVLANVKERESEIPEAEYERVKQELHNMHFSKSEIEFNSIKDNAIKRWRENEQLVWLADYFTTQWLDSEFNNWQIYKSPQGFAATNNPLESFNGRIKTHFTKRRVVSISIAIDLICKELITFYSLCPPLFMWHRIADAQTKRMASLLPEKDFKLDGSRINHIGLVSEHVIDTVLKTCSCRWFLAYSMCSHLYRASMIYSFQPNNDAPTKFFLKKKEGKIANKKTFKLTEQESLLLQQKKLIDQQREQELFEQQQRDQAIIERQQELIEKSGPITRKRRRALEAFKEQEEIIID